MEQIKHKLKSKINMQSILYLYIILCPILDCMSFIFRNTLKTNISPSTIIRPIFVITVCLYIFITDKKQRKIFLLAGLTYGIYAITHLYIFTLVKNNSSYSGIIHELQYLVNYTFMALNLYVYIYTFAKHKDTDKLSKCVLISVSIYIISIYVSILTGTSSNTYMLEKMGYKGWFESGNSLSAILILSMFILLNIFAKNNISKKTKMWAGFIITIVGIFLISLIGTRTGLYGVILAIGIYGIAYLACNIIHRRKVKQTLIIVFGAFILAIIAIILLFSVIGSNTLDRRQKVEDMANEVVDKTTNEKVHITGDMYEIKNKIENGTLEEGYMSEEQKQAVIALNEIATKNDLSVEQMRTLQIIYNTELAKNQSNIIYILFGNGYVSQYREMVLEMELLAIPINFGLYGFMLYLMPFITVYIYSVYKLLRNLKNIEVEDIMLIAGGGLAFALSLLSGYIFFSASTTMIIIVIDTLLIIRVKDKKSVERGGIKINMKKLLFGITSLTIGGAERVLVDLANELCEKYEITIFTIYPNGEFEKNLSPKIDLKSLYNKQYKELSKIQKVLIPLKVWLNQKSIYKKHIKNDYDVEIAFLEGAITRIFSTKNKDTQKIAWIHNDISKVFGKSIKSKIKKSVDQGIYSKFDKLVFVSKDNEEKFREVYKNNTVQKEVIYNYIDANRVIEKANEVPDIKFDNNNINFVTVARLVEQKALDRLINVHSKLIKDGMKHNFYIIGEGPEKNNLEKLISDNNVQETFKLLEKRENPYPFVKQADYFCLLSHFEGYPMVVEEAKILNKQILITNTAAREVVKNYDNCKIFENSENGIYEGLKNVIKEHKTENVCIENTYNNKDIITKIIELVGE